MSTSTPSGSGFDQPTDPWASSDAGSPPAGGSSSGGAGSSSGSSGGVGQAKQVAGTAADHAQQVAGTAAEQAQQVAGTAADQVQQVAGTAAEQAQQVAGTAAEQVQQVAGTAAEQAQHLFADTRGRLQQEAGQQQTKVVEGLRSLGDELAAMTNHEGESGVATDLARRGQGYVTSAAEWLDSREPGELVGELRRFAQRRPGAFLAGAVLAGVMAGRLTRGATAQAQSGPAGSSPSAAGGAEPSSPGAVTGMPADPYLDSRLPAVTPGPGPYDPGVPAVATPYVEPQSGPYGTSTYSTPTQYGAIPDDTSALPNRPLSQP